MITKEGWKIRKKRYGQTGSKNPKLTKQKQSKVMKRWHKEIGFSEETKRKIKINSGKSRLGKFYPNSSHFKKGENHKDWEGGKSNYWHRKARKIMKKAGFNIKGLDVHHKNHDFRDNRLENLELINHKEHGKYHALKRLGLI